MKTNNIIKYSTAGLYIVLYVIVATISCLCSIDFFNITHTDMSSIILAISFEIGSMGCLFGALTTLRNKDNTLIWIMFFFLTIMQMMNNTYYSYAHAENYKDWVELFNLVDLEVITQKRIIAIISGCVLPIVSLSFIHLLVDLLRAENKEIIKEDTTVDEVVETDEDDDYDDILEKERKELIKENKERKEKESIVHDAIPLTEEQEIEFEKNRKKSDVEIAKNELSNAMNMLKEYNNKLINGDN